MALLDADSFFTFEQEHGHEHIHSCRGALERKDSDTIAELMRANFELRRQIFGDSVIGKANLRMVEVAAAHGGEHSGNLNLQCQAHLHGVCHKKVLYSWNQIQF